MIYYSVIVLIYLCDNTTKIWLPVVTYDWNAYSCSGSVDLCLNKMYEKLDIR